MAETEVESILREIRERVLSQQRAGHDVAASAADRATIGNEGNGASDSGATQRARQGDPETVAAEKLALINSYLTTTARAWDRLPPLVSNRGGFAARLELWFKRRLRAGTRWFTWEQVNFNAAVHHALRDMLPVFAAYEQELGKLRTMMDAEADAQRNEIEQHNTALAAQRAEIEALRQAIEKQRRATDAQRSQLDARIAELVRELRERDERLQGEQRVSFKQLALETSEAAMLEDRARRKSEALLEELKRRVEQLEKH
jgi:hypothetical protein